MFWKLVFPTTLLLVGLCNEGEPKMNFPKSSIKLEIKTSCKEIIELSYNKNSGYDGLVMSGYLNVGIEKSSSALGFKFYGAKGVK